METKYICTKKICNKSVIVYWAIIGESFKLHGPCAKDIFIVFLLIQVIIWIKEIVYNYVMWYCITGSTICK